MSAPLQHDIIPLFVILVNNNTHFLLNYDKRYDVYDVYLLRITMFSDKK